MNNLNQYILEKLKLNKDYDLPELNKLEDLIIEIAGKEYKHSIGENLPIIDYAETPEEAIVMIERDSEEGDRFHWIKPRDNGNWYGTPDFYWTKYTKDGFLLQSKDGDKYKEYNIESMYNTQHLMLVKVDDSKLKK